MPPSRPATSKIGIEALSMVSEPWMFSTSNPATPSIFVSWTEMSAPTPLMVTEPATSKPASCMRPLPSVIAMSPPTWLRGPPTSWATTKLPEPLTKIEPWVAKLLTSQTPLATSMSSTKSRRPVISAPGGHATCRRFCAAACLVCTNAEGSSARAEQLSRLSLARPAAAAPVSVKPQPPPAADAVAAAVAVTIAIAATSAVTTGAAKGPATLSVEAGIGSNRCWDGDD
mmetsp:Transcript_11758/g.29631  ORF Transcript_11758/g.29631 Transcript_11758/m.29631 type:complete len:228 (+) Transcript_11758:679-1362(+)